MSTLIESETDTQAAFNASAVQHLSDGVYFVDQSRRILYWNKAAERISGHCAADVTGRACFDNILRHVNDAGTPLCHTACPLAKTMADGRVRETDVFLFHRAGHRQPVRIRTVPVKDAGGAIVGAVEIFSDGSEVAAVRKKIEELGRLALVDDLTGIGNRRYMEMTLRAKVEESSRYGHPFGLLFIDVDHFKRVNDEYGHAVGDDALRTVARTINGNSRIFDTVGRWGGEEFLVISPNVTAATLEPVAERLRALVEQSGLPLPTGELRMTVSIGGVASRGGTPVAELVECADRLMFEAKRLGRNRVVQAALS